MARQDSQHSFSSCQNSGMCGPVLSRLWLGKYSAENKHSSFLMKDDIRDPLTHTKEP